MSVFADSVALRAVFATIKAIILWTASFCPNRLQRVWTYGNWDSRIITLDWRKEAREKTNLRNRVSFHAKKVFLFNLIKNHKKGFLNIYWLKRSQTGCGSKNLNTLFLKAANGENDSIKKENFIFSYPTAFHTQEVEFPRVSHSSLTIIYICDRIE